METIYILQPGEYIIREGESSKGFYILRSGVLEVKKQNVIVAEITEPETIFGEMSDILGEPRTCSVVAKVVSNVSYVQQSIRDIVRDKPELTMKILYSLAKNLKHTTEGYWLVITDQVEERGRNIAIL